jgi:LacI family transcriptional regulator
LPATIRDVAAKAGTSTAAVSAVLRNGKATSIRVGAATRERILAAAEALGYTGNALARALATGKTGVVGVLFPYFDTFVNHQPFMTQVISGVLEEAEKQRLQVLLQTGNGENWQDVDPAELMDSRSDGLIAIAPRAGSPLIRRCTQTGFRCLAVSYEPEDGEALTINGDDFGGGVLAVKHLVSLGHRRIGFLAGEPDSAFSVRRQAGYLQGLQEAGIDAEPGLIIPAGLDVANGQAAAQRVLDLPARQRPTAVFAVNDPCADGALRAFKAAGVGVPGDMAVMGFDDTWYARWTDPPLSSINMPLYSMGRLAMQMMAAEIQGKKLRVRQATLRVHLRIRESCGGDPSKNDFPITPAIDELPPLVDE